MSGGDDAERPRESSGRGRFTVSRVSAVDPGVGGGPSGELGETGGRGARPHAGDLSLSVTDSDRLSPEPPAGPAESGGGRGRGQQIRRFLLVLLFIIMEPIILGLDPAGLTTATQNVSSSIAGRIMAPFYGYVDPEEIREQIPNWAEDEPPVSRSTQDIVVVLIDDPALRIFGSHWPMPYREQLSIYRRILREKPVLLFSDLLYSYDRGGLDKMMERIAADGTRLTRSATTFVDENGDPLPKEAGGRPISETGVMFVEIGASVIWTDAEAALSLLEPFEKGIVGSESVGQEYTFAEPTKNFLAAPTAAVKMFEIVCRTDAVRPAAERRNYPGCADLDEILAKPPGDKMWLYWGNMTQNVWEPTGDFTIETMLAQQRAETPEQLDRDKAQDQLERAVARANREATDEGSQSCRHFLPDFVSRARETLRQTMISFAPSFARDTVETRCPYTLSIPAEQLRGNSEEMRAYLTRALQDKIVILGVSVLGVSDRVEILDTKGPGVYTHAMALDNLLKMGANYLRYPETIEDIAGFRTVFGFEIADLGLQYDIFLEIGYVLALVWAYWRIGKPIENWALRRTGVRTVGSLAGLFAIFLIAVALSGAAIALTTTALNWVPYNFVGSGVYAVLAARASYRRLMGEEAA